MENWRDVPGAYGYQVSDIGRVRSFHVLCTDKVNFNIEPRIMKTQPKRDNRQTVSLSINCKLVVFYIHSLILCAFVGPRPDGMEACHNDGNKYNNCLENLRWDTHQNNVLDRNNHGTSNRGKKYNKINSTHLTETEVIKLRELFVPFSKPL